MDYRLFGGLWETNSNVIILEGTTGANNSFCAHNTFNRKVHYDSLIGNYVVIDKKKYVLTPTRELVEYFI